MEWIAAVDENIVGLDISMRDANMVQMLQSGEQLGCHCIDVRFGQVSTLVDQAAKITARNEFHDDV
jgi:hypothetical protein